MYRAYLSFLRRQNGLIRFAARSEGGPNTCLPYQSFSLLHQPVAILGEMQSVWTTILDFATYKLAVPVSFAYSATDVVGLFNHGRSHLSLLTNSSGLILMVYADCMLLHRSVLDTDLTKTAREELADKRKLPCDPVSHTSGFSAHNHHLGILTVDRRGRVHHRRR